MLIQVIKVAEGVTFHVVQELPSKDVDVLRLRRLRATNRAQHDGIQRAAAEWQKRVLQAVEVEGLRESYMLRKYVTEGTVELNDETPRLKGQAATKPLGYGFWRLEPVGILLPEKKGGALVSDDGCATTPGLIKLLAAYQAPLAYGGDGIGGTSWNAVWYVDLVSMYNKGRNVR